MGGGGLAEKQSLNGELMSKWREGGYFNKSSGKKKRRRGEGGCTAEVGEGKERRERKHVSRDDVGEKREDHEFPTSLAY